MAPPENEDIRTVPFGVAHMRMQSIRAEVIAGEETDRGRAAIRDELTLGNADGNDLVLHDSTVSRYHAELSRCQDGVMVVDHGSTNGTFVGAVRVERAVVPPRTLLRLGRTTVQVSDGEALQVDVHERDSLGELRGRSPVMRRLFAQICRAADGDATVLLVGESGTGKELIARALHEQSPRAAHPFVTVDCAALSPTLVASDLFGHERGAFTGADRQHIGCFERAQGGTLFLDEIGELPAPLQATLLGAVERRRFRRLGGSVELPVDVRILSATNRDLRADVNKGTFRLDLYFRLAVVTLLVPPLRDRIDDVPLLVEYFLRETGYSGTIDDIISPGAMNVIKAHRFPGNVRELRNLVEATLTMGEAPQLEMGPPAEPAAGDAPDEELRLSYGQARRRVLDRFEVAYVRRLLDEARGNVSRAARAAQMDRSYLMELITRHKLK